MQQNVYAMSPAEAEVQERSFVARVYTWMFTALVVTGGVALLTASNEAMVKAILGNQGIFIGLLIAEVALVWGLSLIIGRISPATAAFLFFLYAALNGLTMAVIFLIYTAGSIATTFFAAAGAFGAMALYGHITHRDLTSIGNLCIMGLVGVVIASIANFFLRSTGLYWAITYIGIAVFVGLTAYDAQKIKNIGQQVQVGSDAGRRAAVMGALVLYLDFINLFLLLLRLMGRRR